MHNSRLTSEQFFIDFALRERLVNKTDAKLLTSKLIILQIYRPKV